MCRRIIIHRMHHDVRSPMMLDPDSHSHSHSHANADAAQPPGRPYYANPLRTSYHQCEVSLPPAGQMLLNSGGIRRAGACEYHSCCAPLVETRLCAAALGAPRPPHELLDIEPEECEHFVLEHRHHHLNCFGMAPGLWYDDDDDSHHHPEEVCGSGSDDKLRDRSRSRTSRADAHVHYAATWRRDLEEVRWGENWNPAFAHEERFRARWEEAMFRDAESLYTLASDADTHFAVMRDLHALEAAPAMVAAAGANYLRARQRLDEQREDIRGMLRWAREPCLSC
ncbi:hypothetical protein DL766_010426 [Monosporascus sp. MC13-8B]|nr:hypothetical protein DL763_005667 [Monosporascus cannonballus]RYP02339.1 hypothetical protein DL766_010426 [Monosporascus sp. MC13-8B]